MLDRETMKMQVDHIPTHHETKAKCFELIDKEKYLMLNAKGCYEDGMYIAAKHYLDKSQETIEEIRVLIGGSSENSY